MDEDSAVIWVKVGKKKSEKIIIGGAYREHKQPGGDPTPSTWMEQQRL